MKISELLSVGFVLALMGFTGCATRHLVLTPTPGHINSSPVPLSVRIDVISSREVAKPTSIIFDTEVAVIKYFKERRVFRDIVPERADARLEINSKFVFEKVVGSGRFDYSFELNAVLDAGDNILGRYKSYAKTYSKGSTRFTSSADLGPTNKALSEALDELCRKIESDQRRIKDLFDSKVPRIQAYTEAGDQARKAGDKSTALKNYVAAFGEAPPGAEIKRELRMKIIRFVRSMKKPPPVPEDAKHHSLRAQSFLKRAKSEAGYKKAEKELEASLRIAPWWGDAYFNLGLVQEKLKDYKTAVESLKLYIAAAPNARDIGKIKKKIVDLEVAQELAQ